MAWSFIQQPRSTGGLNVINLVLWNTTTILKLLWAIAFKQDKLWVRWVNATTLNEAQLTMSLLAVTLHGSLKIFFIQETSW